MSSEPKKPYTVFLSHSAKDKPAARHISEALKSQGVSVFWDVESVPFGERWDVALKEALQKSDNFVLLVSKAFQPDDPVSRDWSAALLRHAWENPDVRLIPVILGDADLPNFLKDRKAIKADRSPEGLDQVANKIVRVVKSSEAVDTKQKLKPSELKDRLDRFQDLEKAVDEISSKP